MRRMDGMPSYLVTPARSFALDILLAVEERSAYAADKLYTPAANQLAPADRRLAHEIVLGVLRWRAQLDYILSGAARRSVDSLEPVVRAALRMGLYQLRFLDRVPASAAVNESVDLVKIREPKAAGFVNAVLRHVSRRPIETMLTGERNASRRREVLLSHPAWMLDRWIARFGEPATKRIAAYNNAVPPVAIRIRRGQVESVRTSLSRDGVELTPGLLPGPAQATSFRVERGDVTRTTAYRSGQLWIQDEASQRVAALVDAQPGDWVLDACAAPGLKSAQIRDYFPDARLVALELHPHRARRMARVARTGGISVVIADSTQPLPFRSGLRFDRILVDAPCTGTGTLARNPEIRWRLQPSDLARLRALQIAILSSAACHLKSGGRLIYSVCSIEPEEGLEVLGRVSAAVPHLKMLAEPTLLLPGERATDGFFTAILTAS